MNRIRLAFTIILAFTLVTPSACSGAKAEPTAPAEVVKPAEFRVNSLEVTPRELILGDSATVSVEVRNIGDLSANYTCDLIVDEISTEKKEITLLGGAKEKVGFTLKPKERGVHKVAVGNFIQTINVRKPADFFLSSLKISPKEVTSGSSVTITATVTNAGDINGDTEVTLSFNGKTESQKVNLSGSENKTVSFAVVAQAIGVYRLELKAGFRTLNGTFAVVPNAPVGYKGYTDQENGFFVVYSETWKPVEGAPGLVSFISPEDPYHKNLWIAKYSSNVTISKTARQFVEEHFNGILKQMGLVIPGSIQDVTINGVPAAIGFYDTPIYGGISKNHYVVLVLDKTEFTMTLQSKADYKNKVGIFDTITNSFTFLPTYP